MGLENLGLVFNIINMIGSVLGEGRNNYSPGMQLGNYNLFNSSMPAYSGCGGGGFSDLFSSDPISCYDGFGSTAEMEMQMRMMNTFAECDAILKSPMVDPYTGQMVIPTGSPANQSTGNLFADVLGSIITGGRYTFGTQTSRGASGNRLKQHGIKFINRNSIETKMANKAKNDGKNYFDVLKGNEEDPNAKSRSENLETGALGTWQIMPSSLQTLGFIDANGKWKGKWGLDSKDEFLNSPDLQKDIMLEYNRMNWKTAGTADKQGNKLTDYLNDYDQNGVKITEEYLLAGMHLGGPGNMKEYLEGGKDEDDGSVKVSTYAMEMQGTTLTKEEYDYIINGIGQINHPNTN